MANYNIETNPFFMYLKNEFESLLLCWSKPNWVVCIPNENAQDGIEFSPALAGGQALQKFGSDGTQYVSELCGKSIVYKVTGVNPRCITAHDDIGLEISMTKVGIITEHLLSVQDKVIHLLLTDGFLTIHLDDEQMMIKRLPSIHIRSYNDAEEFLKHFHAYHPVIAEVSNEIQNKKKEVIPKGDIEKIQKHLHNLYLDIWTRLINRNSSELKTNQTFQDNLYRVLDYYVMGKCHNELWWEIVKRCSSVEQNVQSQLNYLRAANFSSVQLGASLQFYTPLSAAVVELASLGMQESAIGRLQCVCDTIELILAEAKEARIRLHEFKNQLDTDLDKHELLPSNDELVALLATAIMQAKCTSLVASIYYMTHFILSVTDESHKLWQSLCIFRKALEKLMKLNIQQLPLITIPIRKELSLQDLMQVSSEVESRFESKPKGSKSTTDLDFTALDLQMHQLTQKLQLSTQANLENVGLEMNISKECFDSACLSTYTQPPRRMHNFM